MASVIAAALNDGETVVMGANSLLPMAGARLAQLTHAPNLSMIAGASGGVNSLLEPLAPSSGDYANLVAEAVLPFPEVLMLQMGGHIDVFFAGGIQIDRRGNCNLAFVGDAQIPKLRGPGSAGLPWAVRSRRTILYTTTHDRRVFVPKVDFVSMPGIPESGPEGSSVGLPVLVVTPLAVLDFGTDGNMRLRSVHQGITTQEVADNTGFDLSIPGDVPVTPQPTDEQLRLMREFDPDALLTIVV
jgi:glutaconate CoA-transferase, subunit B